MVFEEPKVEVVKIDLEDAITTSGGSMETCNGTDAPSNSCKARDVWFADNR